MANKSVFKSKRPSVQPTNTVNAAGGVAYSFSDEHALAQYVVTSCFGGAFYASATEQVDRVLKLAQGCTPEFVAKAAVYGHQVAGMKDTPAFLAAVLSTRGEEGLRLLERIFPRVITRPKMLMNFAQIVRSGKVGRQSFGSATKRFIREWLNSHSGDQLFTGSIGADPSLADIIKMVHPRPSDAEHNAFFGYMLGRQYDAEALPRKVKHYEAFKRLLNGQAVPAEFGEVPDVPFQMVSSLPNLKPGHWHGIAANMPWNALRMNLNTLARHDVFKDTELLHRLATKLADPNEVRRNNVFPYQLLTTFQNTEDIPSVLRNALQDAMEVATENLPDFGTGIAVGIDVSSSMDSPATGQRTGSTTKTKCVDVAALVGAGLARKNKDCILIPFDTTTKPTTAINTRDSVMTNAVKLAKMGGGGTASALPLMLLNGLVGNRPQVVLYVSDNMSWFNAGNSWAGGAYGTQMAQEWQKYQQKVPNAKLVCIDIQATDSTQVSDQKNVLNIGGFSDKVWPVIERFVKQGNTSFVDTIKAIDI